jgi:aminopeptidase N
MMWGALWDSVREAELDPREYVRLVYRILGSPAYRRPPQDDESTVASLLGRLGTAMNYYVPQTDLAPEPSYEKNDDGRLTVFGSNALQGSVETMLMAGMSSKKQSERIVYFRALLNIARSKGARDYLKQILAGETKARIDEIPIRTKDKFDIVTRLAILGDPDAARLLGELEKTETSDDAKRYAYAARAAFPTKENREKFWNDFVNNKTISESWIEAAIGPFNSPLHDDLSLPYLTRALGQLPNLKRTRKIFFVNNWLGAFIGGQRSQAALDIVNKFLADNPNLDRDLRLKILENVDVIERAVKIRNKFSK